jgi:acyl-CoA thioesterase-1
MLDQYRVAFSALAFIASQFPLLEAAHAEEIVALGASNTYGRGVGKHSGGVDESRAFPAQLQALLAEQSCNATVANEGIPGDTTEGMFGRLKSALQADTKVLILQPGGNDARRGISGRDDNINRIKATAQAKGIEVIILDDLNSIAGAFPAGDGEHYTVEGHIAIAKYLLPKVLSTGVCKN